MSQPYRLLIVDDNEDILLSFYDFFTSLDYSVKTATNGLDAVKILKEDSKGFDALITDLVMPNISGVGLIAMTKNQYPTMRIIAITGWGDHPGALASEADADIVLYKPVDLFKIEAFLIDLLTNTKAGK